MKNKTPIVYPAEIKDGVMKIKTKSIRKKDGSLVIQSPPINYLVEKGKGNKILLEIEETKEK